MVIFLGDSLWHCFTHIKNNMPVSLEPQVITWLRQGTHCPWSRKPAWPRPCWCSSPRVHCRCRTCSGPTSRTSWFGTIRNVVRCWPTKRWSVFRHFPYLEGKYEPQIQRKKNIFRQTPMFSAGLWTSRFFVGKLNQLKPLDSNTGVRGGLYYEYCLLGCRKLPNFGQIHPIGDKTVHWKWDPNDNVDGGTVFKSPTQLLVWHSKMISKTVLNHPTVGLNQAKINTHENVLQTITCRFDSLQQKCLVMQLTVHDRLLVSKPILII